MGGVQQTKPLAVLYRQKKGFGLHARNFSDRNFLVDKVRQRAHRGEGGALQIVIVHGHVKPVLQRGDERHYGHGVQLWYGAQQQSVPRELRATPFQTQNFIQYTQDFLQCVQFNLPLGQGGATRSTVK